MLGKETPDEGLGGGDEVIWVGLSRMTGKCLQYVPIVTFMHRGMLRKAGITGRRTRIF